VIAPEITEEVKKLAEVGEAKFRQIRAYRQAQYGRGPLSNEQLAGLSEVNKYHYMTDLLQCIAAMILAAKEKP
jgi:hypothetical protein